MNKRLYSIRGATCAENTAQSIMEGVKEMCSRLFELNKVESQDLVNIHFTMTKDLDALNAATALRKTDTGIDTSTVPLFTSQEAEIKGMLPKVIRVMVTLYLPEGSKITPVYVNGAQALRPDFKS
ncbi:chorismate mutase [Treponema sp.]|uniref:chorismate mutase n=1 Tax=Treponema sp. TaxID=166 RepID=UPI0025CD08C2|nr:chorismate mutase [Treponema sp.]MCR5218856.1 chorismate mutase [Treponema sp.]